MTVVYGTLGFTPKKLLPSLASHAGVERLVFYHDKAARSRDAAATVRRSCHERGIGVEGHELDAFDILACATRMRRDLRREKRETVVFNITGGTPVLSASATLVCILEGVRAVYVDEREGREVPLPLLTLRYEEILNEEQRRVLAFVAKRRVQGCVQADIAAALGLARATVSHHVRNLKERQLVRGEPDRKDGRREILRPLESAFLLLEGA